MSQSLAKVIVHIVYSTKNRVPWLKEPDIRSELCAYNATILKNDVDPSGAETEMYDRLSSLSEVL